MHGVISIKEKKILLFRSLISGSKWCNISCFFIYFLSGSRHFNNNRISNLYMNIHEQYVCFPYDQAYFLITFYTLLHEINRFRLTSCKEAPLPFLTLSNKVEKCLCIRFVCLSVCPSVCLSSL